MSSWIKGKIALGCSIDILQKALIRIDEDWKNHIDVDPDGKLKIGGRNETFHLVLREGSNVGFTKLDDNTWEMVSYDFSYRCVNLKGKLKQTVAEMRYEAMTEIEAVSEIIERGTVKGKKRLVIRTPVKKEYLYEA